MPIADGSYRFPLIDRYFAARAQTILPSLMLSLMEVL